MNVGELFYQRGLGINKASTLANRYSVGLYEAKRNEKEEERASDDVP